MIKSGNIEVTARNTFAADSDTIILVPAVNITKNLLSQKEVNVNIENWNDIINNAEMDTLSKAIMKQKEESSNSPNTHDIHHYTISYTLVCIVIIIIIVGIWKYIQCQKKTRTSAVATDLEITTQPEEQPSGINSVTFYRSRVRVRGF